MPYKTTGGISRPHYDMGTNMRKKMRAGMPQRMAVMHATNEAMKSLKNVGKKAK